MKKLITTILFCIITLIVQAQFTSNAVVRGVNNGEGYEWGSFKSTDISINIKGNLISVSDISRSRYTTTELIKDDVVKKEASWYAFDEKNNKCVVKLTAHDGKKMMFFVFYDNIAFGYTLEIARKLDVLN